jgi:hypothetical protein
MSNSTYYKFFHRADILEKRLSTSPAGQKVASFEVVDTIPLVFQSPSISSTGGERRRVAPYQDNIDIYELIIPYLYVANINYENRVSNIKDREGNDLYNQSLEIYSIQPKFGFSGKLHHYQVMARRVVETI